MTKKHHLNMGITKRVEIVRISWPDGWYAEMAGDEFWVYDYITGFYILKDNFDSDLQARRLLDTGDCRVVEVIRERER